MNTIKIILADDHTLVRAGLKALLSLSEEFEVIGEAGDGEEAIRLVEDLQPDLLVLDLSMPHMGGTECIREIRSRGIACRILVLTMYDEESYIREVMQSGADGYLLKKSADTELIQAIHKIYCGGKYLNEEISEVLIHSLQQGFCQKEDTETDPYVLLSIREREVLRYLAQGFSNSEIADILTLSPKTIDTYRSRIMSKLNLRKKSELVQYAVQHGLFGA